MDFSFNFRNLKIELTALAKFDCIAPGISIPIFHISMIAS
jgi:hypothetical protein